MRNQVRQDQREQRASLVLSFDSHIRCCIVFGADGRRLETRFREGSTLEPDRDTDLALELAAMFVNQNRHSTRYHGRMVSVMVASEWLTVLAYPVSDKLVMATADPGFALEKMNDLGKLLRHLFYWVGETPRIANSC